MPGPITLGYVLAAAAYTGLFLMLRIAWEGRGQGSKLISASFVTAAWAAVLAIFAALDMAPAVPAFLVETLRNAAWLVVLAGLVEAGGFPRIMARASYLAWGGLLVAGVLALVTPLLDFVTVGLFGGLLLPLIGLVLLEQIYRNANSSGRWALKFLYVGLGGVFVYDVFLYSQALLLGGITPEAWFARGYILALAVPFIAIAARRNPSWSIRVFVSRDVVFYTTSFLAIGSYLLLMAAGGYLVRFLGGTWGGVVQVVFFAAALGLLAAMVGSTTLRRKLKVFLVKHFYRHKYEYREEWLRFIATLSEDHEGEDPRATGIRAIAQIISSPAAVLLTYDETHAECAFAAAWPVDTLVPASAGSLCADPQFLDFMGRREWVVDLAEYRRDRDAYEQLELPDWLVSRGDWRLVVPVLLRDRLLGILVLRDPPFGFELTFEDRDLLKTVARHVAAHLAQYDYEKRLAESRQFETYSRLTAFLMHDLKNAVAQLNLVVTNAGRHKANPEFVDDAIDTVASAAQRITRLIEQLRRGESGEAAERVALEDLLRAAVERSADREPKPALVVEQAGLAVAASRERLVNVLEHVIRNAQDATPRDGQVTVRLTANRQSAIVEVADTGQGMSAEFIRERLFRPFDSTKGSKGMGIGAYQAREYARSLGGDVEVESSPGRGTAFRIILPAMTPPAVA